MGWEGCLLVRWHVQSRVQQQLEVPKGCTSGSILVGYTHEEPKNLMTRWPLLFYQYIPAAGLIHTEAQCSQGCMQHINSVACKQWIVLVRWRQWFRMLTTSDLVHCYYCSSPLSSIITLHLEFLLLSFAEAMETGVWVATLLCQAWWCTVSPPRRLGWKQSKDM